VGSPAALYRLAPDTGVSARALPSWPYPRESNKYPLAIQEFEQVLGAPDLATGGSILSEWATILSDMIGRLPFGGPWLIAGGKSAYLRRSALSRLATNRQSENYRPSTTGS